MSLVQMPTFKQCYFDPKWSQLCAICVPFNQTELMLYTEPLQSFAKVKNQLKFVSTACQSCHLDSFLSLQGR